MAQDGGAPTDALAQIPNVPDKQHWFDIEEMPDDLDAANVWSVVRVRTFKQPDLDNDRNTRNKRGIFRIANGPPYNFAQCSVRARDRVRPRSHCEKGHSQ